MNTVFITGASGFIGGHLAGTLAQVGHRVHVLTRTTSQVKHLQHDNIKIFSGDLLDQKSLQQAMAGCSQVYHLAGLAKMWMSNKQAYYDVNVTGTENVLKAAAACQVEKIIVTSTAGVFPPSNGVLTNENTPRQPALYTEYERTKNAAEELALSHVTKGLPVIIINPTKVYGPGPIDDSNTATLMVRDYLRGKWKIIPGNGKGAMNYVYIDDAVSGIMTAMETASPGSQYIIGGENASYDRFFSLIKQLSGVNRRLYHIPYPIIRSIAWLEDTKTALFKTRPVITSEWVKKLPYDWSKDIGKAQRELNYQARSLEEGLRQTIDWLRKTKQV